VRFYVVGGGPSIADLDVEKLRHKNIIVTNNAYQLVPWAQYLYFMDAGPNTFYDIHKDKLHTFKGQIVTTAHQLSGHKEFIYLPQGKYSLEMDSMHRGSNSGQGAIQLAAKLGAKEIILLGFDMRKVDGKNNYHNEHKQRVRDNLYETDHIPKTETLKPFLDSHGIKVINCTPNSALKCFPIEPLEEWI
jgi:hypothetical protein